jgi:hypothetical protein
MFYNWKNEILIKILVGKSSGIGIIEEFLGILTGFSTKVIDDLPAPHQQTLPVLT